MLSFKQCTFSHNYENDNGQLNVIVNNLWYTPSCLKVLYRGLNKFIIKYAHKFLWIYEYFRLMPCFNIINFYVICLFSNLLHIIWLSPNMHRKYICHTYKGYRIIRKHRVKVFDYLRHDMTYVWLVLCTYVFSSLRREFKTLLMLYLLFS